MKAGGQALVPLTVTIGYWARRWGLEATLGVGYLFLKYDKYRCEKCGELEARTTGHYFGPTKVGLTLIFLIK